MINDAAANIRVDVWVKGNGSEFFSFDVSGPDVPTEQYVEYLQSAEQAVSGALAGRYRGGGALWATEVRAEPQEVPPGLRTGCTPGHTPSGHPECHTRGHLGRSLVGAGRAAQLGQVRYGLLGAGLGGCAAAALLQQQGHDVTVFEQADAD